MARAMPARPSKTFTSSQLLKNNRYHLTQKARAKRLPLSYGLCATCSVSGGAGRDRTDDPLLAKQVLSQLSYSPASDGGSGWTRTIDPRLVKTVL